MSQVLSVFTYQPDYSTMATAAFQASNSDYLLAGRGFDQNGTSSATAVRALENGNLVWEKTYPGPFTTLFASMVEIADGTFIAVGSYFYSNTAGDEDIWIVNLDADGNIVWEQKYGFVGYQNDGLAVTATTDGGFIVTGLSLQHGTNNTTTLILKYDANRNLEWQKQTNDGVCFAIAQTTDKGYILSGAHNIQGTLNSNVYVLRLDSNGDPMWEVIDSNTQVYVLLQSGVTQTSDGGFLVAAKPILMKLDDSGNILWTRNNGNFGLGSVRERADGTIAVGGTLNANYVDHAYVAVLDSTGDDIIWDNTELLFNSGHAEIFINNYDLVTGGGYAPLSNTQSQMFISVYYPSKTFSAAATATAAANEAEA